MKYKFNKPQSCVRLWAQCRVFFIISLLFPLLSACDISEAQDKVFMSVLDSYLEDNNDSVDVFKVHGGAWTKVCPVIEYQRVSEKVAWALNIKSKEVNIINSRDEIVFDGEWGLVFLYPPNEAEYIRVDYFYGSGADCVLRESAEFKLIIDHKGIKRLKLLEKVEKK